MRKLHFISRDRELAGIQKLIYNFKRNDDDWIDDRTLMLMVSPDFSGIVTTILSHGLSKHRKTTMYTDVIHVSDPTEDKELYRNRFDLEFSNTIKGFDNEPYNKFIVAEAGVISGSNYLWIWDKMTNKFNIPEENIRTVALFENIHSAFKCNYVGEYYDNEFEDLCFWWEQPNVAFGDFSEKQSGN